MSVPVDWPASPDGTEAQYGWGWTLLGATKLVDHAGPLSKSSFQLEAWTTLRWNYGLPFRSAGLWEREYMPAQLRGVVRETGTQFQSSWFKRHFQTPELPVIPLWPGFALNTIFYGALAWGLWQVPLAIRRRRRRARGECVRCGYALAGLPPGSPCPECGPSAAK